MNISQFCTSVSQTSFGTQFQYSLEDGSIKPLPQTVFEKIFHACEFYVNKLFFRTSSIKISGLFSKNNSHNYRIDLTHYFESVFGKRRIERILLETNLSRDTTSPYSREEIKQIFSRLVYLQREDYEDLISEIRGKKPLRESLLHRREELQNTFQSINCLDDCSVNEVRELDKLLIPFSSAEEAFLGDTPSLDLSFSTWISREALVRHVAYCVETLRRNTQSIDNWEVFVAKRLSQPEIPQKLILSHPLGCLERKETIQESGAYKILFKAVGKPSEEGPTNYVVYRGTRGHLATDTIRSCYETVREDITKELGARGIIATYEKTKDALTKLAENDEKGFTFLGYSLGGAHAQRDCILFSKHCKRLVTVSSPGIDSESIPLFLSSFKHNPVLKEIVHNINPYDIVHEAGDRLIGAEMFKTTSNEDDAALDKKDTLPKLRVRVHLSPKDEASNQLLREEEWKKESWPISNKFEHIIRRGPFSFISSLVRSAFAHMYTPLPSESATEETRAIELTSKNIAHLRHIEGIVHHKESHIDPRYESIRKMFSFRLSTPFHQFIKTVLEKNS